MREIERRLTAENSMACPVFAPSDSQRRLSVHCSVAFFGTFSPLRSMTHLLRRHLHLGLRHLGDLDHGVVRAVGRSLEGDVVPGGHGGVALRERQPERLRRGLPDGRRGVRVEDGGDVARPEGGAAAERVRRGGGEGQEVQRREELHGWGRGGGEALGMGNVPTDRGRQARRAKCQWPHQGASRCCACSPLLASALIFCHESRTASLVDLSLPE